jgi:cell division protein FtsQ
MSEDTDNERSARSWRTIRQDVTSRAMSKRGRQRQLMAWGKVGLFAGLLGLIGWGSYSVIHAWESDRAALASAVRSAPVREIVLLTDGVLTRDWVARTLALPRDTTLMALDLAALRTKLMASGQVNVAVLTRNFPDTLVVNLQERTPVARIQVADGVGNRQLLVARDGVVYDGANYDRGLVATLPWLAGFTLRRSALGAGYEPIEGMPTVANLLTTAQTQAPHLYREWVIVSLERLRAHGELVVKPQDSSQITFTAKEGFLRQLAQLDFVLDSTRPVVSEENPLLSVNLTDAKNVTVRMARTPDELAQQAPAVHGAPTFQLQSPTPRRKNRDL